MNLQIKIRSSKIIRNVIVVLLLIISVPYIFRVAFDFQVDLGRML